MSCAEVNLGGCTNEKWKTYFDVKQKSKDEGKIVANREFLEAMVLLDDDVRKVSALDIGCGIGLEAAHLIRIGFERVDCIDYWEYLKDYVYKNAPSAYEQGRLTFTAARIEDYLPSHSYDLVVAMASLFFTPEREIFNQTMEKVLGAISPGGYFIGSFYGTECDWGKELPAICLEVPELNKYFQKDFEIVVPTKEDHFDSDTGNGMRHYHILYVVARKRLGST